MPHKLLLADDSVTIQRVIELTFADEDIEVIAVGDGKEAIERILSERPEIILADIGMPERDGYEVAAFVKGHPELAHIPVLLLTGAFEPIDEGRARAAGCDGVLVKPFEPQMVINRVKELLTGRRPTALWAATTLAQPDQPARPPSAGAEVRSNAAAHAGQKATDSTDDYFERLDTAFAEFDASGAPTAQRGRSALTAEQAQPGLTQRPGAAPPEGSPAKQPQTPTPSAARDVTRSDSVSRVALPSGAPLAEAFAALLSAEQGRPMAPRTVRPEHIPDETIEDIVRRVIERMGTQAVQQTVLDVAERMVREEIDRIKRGS